MGTFGRVISFFIKEKGKYILMVIQMVDNIDRHKYRGCVTEARRIVSDKDDYSKSAASLLAKLLYEYGGINNIRLDNLSWSNILKDHSKWVEHDDLTEYWFTIIKEILVEKISKEIE